MNPVTESKSCPKCRAAMLMQKSVGQSEKWKCTGCNAVFFFDDEETEIVAGQNFFKGMTAAEIIGRNCFKPT